jgi:hypothetical protein
MSKIDRTALIQANQTLGQFVEEELIGKGIEITYDEYLKTDHYKNEDFIPKEFREKGYTKEKSKDMSFNEFLSIDGSDDAKEAKPKDQVAKAIESENAKDESGAPSANLSPLPELNPSPPPAKKEDVAEIPPFNIKPVKDLLPPEARTSAFSFLKMGITRYTERVYFWLEAPYKLDAHNEPAFRRSMMDVLTKLYRDFFRPLGKFESQVEPIFRGGDLTVPGAMGFNVYEAISKLDSRATVVKNVRAILRELYNESVAPAPQHPLYYTDVIVFMRDVEKRLLLNMDQIVRRRDIPIKRKHDVANAFRDMYTDVRPPPVVDDRLHKALRPDAMHALQIFFDSGDNHVIRHIYWDMWYSIFQTRVPFDVRAGAKNIRELQQVLRSSSTQMDISSDYPAMISQRAAQKFAYCWFTAQLASRYHKLSFYVNFDDFSLSQMLQCIISKLFLPYSAVHTETIIDVDNYIAKFLVPALPGYRAAKDPYVQSSADARQTNFLTEQHARGALNNGQAFWDFALTTENGAGWAGAGSNHVKPIPPYLDGFLNTQREGLYYAPFGDFLVNRSDVPRQFENLVSWIRGLPGSLTIQSPHSRIGTSFVSLLKTIPTRRQEVSDFAWYAQRVLEKYAVNAMVFENSRKPGLTHQFETDKIVLPDDSAFSLFMLMQPDARAIFTNSMDMLPWSQAVHEEFNVFCELFYLYADKLPDKKYGRTNYIDMAYDSLSVMHHRPVGFVEQLRAVMGRKYIKLLRFPDRVALPGTVPEVFGYLEDFVLDNLEAFGVMPAFYYVPDAEEHSNRIFSRFLLPPVTDVVVPVTYERLQDLLANKEYGALLRRARSEGFNVRFDFPVNFSRDMISQWTPIPDVINFATDSAVVSVSSIPFRFTHSDEVIDDDLQDFATDAHARWLLPDVPFIDKPETFLSELASHLRVPKLTAEYDYVPVFVARHTD